MQEVSGRARRHGPFWKEGKYETMIRQFVLGDSHLGGLSKQNCLLVRVRRECDGGLLFKELTLTCSFHFFVI
jgi:hypothetical protein